MKKLIIGILALVGCYGPARAADDNELQLQFRAWAHHVRQGVVELSVSLRNPTAWTFATIMWNCDFIDRENYVVGRSPLIFHVIPARTVVIVNSMIVATTDMFERGDCKLVGVEEQNKQNERLYPRAPMQLNWRFGTEQALRSWNPAGRIAGRGVVAEDAQGLE